MSESDSRNVIPLNRKQRRAEAAFARKHQLRHASDCAVPGCRDHAVGSIRVGGRDLGLCPEHRRGHEQNVAAAMREETRALTKSKPWRWPLVAIVAVFLFVSARLRAIRLWVSALLPARRPLTLAREASDANSNTGSAS